MVPRLAAAAHATTSRSSPSSSSFSSSPSARRRRSTRITLRTPGRTSSTSSTRSRSTARREDVVSVGGVINGKLVASIPDRPDVVQRRRPLRARRRPARPRHRRAASLRRPQLAPRRDRLVGDLRLLRGRPRAPRRVLRRLDRLRDHALLRPLLRVPGRAARHRARLGARDQRLSPLRDQHPERQPLDPAARHLLRADPVCRTAAARPGALAAREGVRRGVDLAGRVAAARDVLRPAAEHHRARFSSSSR